MPKFLTTHVTSCMTRQDVEKLTKRFLAESSGDIKIQRVQCDTLEGRMICEWEAPDKETLVGWLEKRNVRFRSDQEWAIRVQMETRDGKIVVL